MGDARFDASLDEVRAASRKAALPQVAPETGVQALAALAAETDAMLANVLATRLLNQLRRSATLLQFAGDGVIALDGDGRILFANPAAEALLGWRAEDLRGRDFHDTVRHHKQGERHMPREECEILSAIHHPERVVRARDHDVFERKDGRGFLVGFVAAPILYQNEPTGLAVVFRDITSEKEMEGRLTLSAAALDAVPAPVFWVGRDAEFLYANIAAGEHLGYTRRELLSMRVFDVDVDFPTDRWESYWMEVRRVGSAHLASRHLTREGRLVPVSVRVSHIEHEGQEYHVAVVERIAVRTLPASP